MRMTAPDRPRASASPRSRLTPWLLAAFALAVAGCAQFRLRPDLQEGRKAALYTGPVERAEPARAPVLVVLYDPAAAAPEPIAYDLVPGGGSYAVVALAGDRRLFAFEDLDGDFRYDAGEPSGALDGQPVDARTHPGPGAEGRILVAPGGPPPPFALDLSEIGPGAPGSRQVHLGEVVSLDDPRFDPARAGDGIWEPIGFLRTIGLRIDFLEPWDPARRPVLFVHGMGGTPRDFRTLIERLDRSKYQPWIYYYPTGLSLRFSAWGLDRLLRELEARLDVGRIDLVAHSMGGLVSRAALNLRRERGDRALVERFVTLSTPWAGIPAARMSTLSLTEAPSWRDMIPDSELLRGLRIVPLDPAIEHTLLFGYRADKLSTDSNDGTVTVASELPLEIQEGARRILGFDASHESILADPAVSALVDRVLGSPVAPPATGDPAP